MDGGRVLAAGLALCNAAALGSLAVQWPGLIGSRGITPANVYVKRLRARLDADPRDAERGASGSWLWRAARAPARWASQLRVAPTLFLFTCGSDRSLRVAFAVGFAACGFLAAGVVPSLAALVFAAVYCSFTIVSQPWLGLQFEPMLIETNAVFGLTYALAGAAPWAWVYCLRWLTFRLMLAAGAGKLSSSDTSWRRGTAMLYHYETQPLPSALSRFMHRLPPRLHWWETVATFVPEGMAPLLLYWGPPWRRWLGFIITAGFNVAIGATGNYGHLHMLAICFGLSLVVETGCEGGAPVGIPLLHAGCPPWPATVPGVAVTTLQWLAAAAICTAYVSISAVPLALNFHGILELRVPPPPGWGALERAFSQLQHLRLMGYYNLFANMTKARWELQLEATVDGGASWHEFAYVAKPGGPPATLNDRPRTLLPGHIPRLDWRMWFLPLAVQRYLRAGLSPDMVGAEAWYVAFERKVLEGEPDVLALLRPPPALSAALAAGRRVDAVRSLLYEYRFTDGSTGYDQQRDDMQQRAGEAGGERAGPREPEAAERQHGSSQTAGEQAEGKAQHAAPVAAQSKHEAAGEAAPVVFSPRGGVRRRKASSSSSSTGGTGGKVFQSGPAGRPAPGTSASGLTEDQARRDKLPAADVWQEGRFWKRRFVCVYDAQVATGAGGGEDGR